MLPSLYIRLFLHICAQFQNSLLSSAGFCSLLSLLVTIMSVLTRAAWRQGKVAKITIIYQPHVYIFANLGHIF
jgi:hypothetical protein